MSPPCTGTSLVPARTHVVLVCVSKGASQFSGTGERLKRRFERLKRRYERLKKALRAQTRYSLSFSAAKRDFLSRRSVARSPCSHRLFSSGPEVLSA